MLKSIDEFRSGKDRHARFDGAGSSFVLQAERANRLCGWSAPSDAIRFNEVRELVILREEAIARVDERDASSLCEIDNRGPECACQRLPSRDPQ